MKEASGELSMTAIAVVAIAAIGVVFTTLIWPAIRTGINRNTWCAQAFNCVEGQGGMADCEYCPDTAEQVSTGCAQPEQIRCPINRQQ